MKIAIFSPLNPIKTGIADYTEEMLEALAGYFDIDLYISKEYQPKNESIVSQYKTIPFEIKSFNPSEYFEIIYHMGNYYDGHRYIYESLKKFPGVVVLHDYVLQGFYAERYDATRDFEEYKKLQIKYYGEAGEEIANQISDNSRIPIWESDTAFKYPLNEEIVECAKGIIVHSDFIKQKIKSISDNPVVKIHHHGHKIKKFDRDAIRKKLGVSRDEILLCSVGYINKNKRYDKIIKAYSKIKGLKLKYIIAGLDRGNLLENYISEDSDIIIKGHLPINELEAIISASDICINLRYPTMGESSGSLLRMMGYGKPVLVTNYGSYAEFPDQCVLKINPDIDEEVMITRLITELANDEDMRVSIGKEASEYIKSECNIEKCVAEYAEFINELNMFSQGDQKNNQNQKYLKIPIQKIREEIGRKMEGIDDIEDLILKKIEREAGIWEYDFDELEAEMWRRFSAMEKESNLITKEIRFLEKQNFINKEYIPFGLASTLTLQKLKDRLNIVEEEIRKVANEQEELFNIYFRDASGKNKKKQRNKNGKKKR
jgi:glycosyltransferase involved in cell wall biosynthesis